jgi:hypothetical protein
MVHRSPGAGGSQPLKARTQWRPREQSRCCTFRTVHRLTPIRAKWSGGGRGTLPICPPFECAPAALFGRGCPRRPYGVWRRGTGRAVELRRRQSRLLIPKPLLAGCAARISASESPGMIERCPERRRFLCGAAVPSCRLGRRVSTFVAPTTVERRSVRLATCSRPPGEACVRGSCSRSIRRSATPDPARGCVRRGRRPGRSV